MITIEEMKRPPVSPDELKEAYETLRRFCRECHDSDGCDFCKMRGLCYVNVSPRCWPEYDELRYGEKKCSKARERAAAAVGNKSQS